jgi:hypothetical protein
MAKRAFAVTVVLTLASALLVMAQAPAAPKPTPEHKRLAYLVGTWTFEGEAKASAFGPAGKFSGREVDEWFPGGFFVVIRADSKGRGGQAGKTLAIMGYNPEAKVYTYYGIESGTGVAHISKGTVQGDTWTWNAEGKVGGKPMKLRYIMKELSPTSCTLKFESSPDGKTWTTIMERKDTKTK